MIQNTYDENLIYLERYAGGDTDPDTHTKADSGTYAGGDTHCHSKALGHRACGIDLCLAGGGRNHSGFLAGGTGL